MFQCCLYWASTANMCQGQPHWREKIAEPEQVGAAVKEKKRQDHDDEHGDSLSIRLRGQTSKTHLSKHQLSSLTRKAVLASGLHSLTSFLELFVHDCCVLTQGNVAVCETVSRQAVAPSGRTHWHPGPARAMTH
eukprot:2770675-Rhodomonas_salina.2